MSDDICLGIADAEHVCHIALTQLLTLESGNGHVCSHSAADGVIANLPVQLLCLLVVLQFVVIGLRPIRELIHIIGTRDEAYVLRVKPVGCIARTSCRQDGCTLLIRHTNDLRAEVCMHPQLVANGRREKVTR